MPNLCSRCHQVGHNRRNRRCPLYVPPPPREATRPLQRNPNQPIINEYYFNIMLELFANLNTRRPRPPVYLTKDYLKRIDISIKNPESDEQAFIENECGICLESQLHYISVHPNCGHSMCCDCTQNYCKSIKEKTTRPNCPTCRAEFTRFVC